jgi:hypothetical protein
LNVFRRRLACAALLTAAVSLDAWAGGGSFGDPDEHGPDEGPGYYGFARDERGAGLRDVRVTATHNSLSFVSRTNATGAYRLRGFRKDINPNEVTIACSKEGYTQMRVFRRPLVKGKPVKAVETECRLKKQ